MSGPVACSNRACGKPMKERARKAGWVEYHCSACGTKRTIMVANPAFVTHRWKDDVPPAAQWTSP